MRRGESENGTMFFFWPFGTEYSGDTYPQGIASLALGHILARLRRYGLCFGFASVFLEGSAWGIQRKNTVDPGFPLSSFVTRGAGLPPSLKLRRTRRGYDGMGGNDGMGG